MRTMTGAISAMRRSEFKRPSQGGKVGGNLMLVPGPWLRSLRMEARSKEWSFLVLIAR